MTKNIQKMIGEGGSNDQVREQKSMLRKQLTVARFNRKNKGTQ